jgi:hypothetical protein
MMELVGVYILCRMCGDQKRMWPLIVHQNFQRLTSHWFRWNIDG